MFIWLRQSVRDESPALPLRVKDNADRAFMIQVEVRSEAKVTLMVKFLQMEDAWNVVRQARHSIDICP